MANELLSFLLSFCALRILCQLQSCTNFLMFLATYLIVLIFISRCITYSKLYIYFLWCEKRFKDYFIIQWMCHSSSICWKHSFSYLFKNQYNQTTNVMYFWIVPLIYLPENLKILYYGSIYFVISLEIRNVNTWALFKSHFVWYWGRWLSAGKVLAPQAGGLSSSP